MVPATPPPDCYLQGHSTDRSHLQVPMPYPSSIFIREKAIIVNLESIRMLICENQVGCYETAVACLPCLPVHPPVLSAGRLSAWQVCTCTDIPPSISRLHQNRPSVLL